MLARRTWTGVLAGALALCVSSAGRVSETAPAGTGGSRTPRPERKEPEAARPPETDFDFAGPPVQAPHVSLITDFLSATRLPERNKIRETREERPDGARVTRRLYEDTSVWGLPGGWERYTTYEHVATTWRETKGLQGSERLFVGEYPHFLRVDFVDDPAVGRRDRHPPPGGRAPGYGCVRFSVTGGRAAIRCQKPYRVDAGHAYEVDGWVRLENVRKPDTEAVLRAEWVKQVKTKQGETEWQRLETHPFTVSKPVKREASGRGWVRLAPLRINSIPPGAQAMRIWCEAGGSDRKASIHFDDISVCGRPRVALSTTCVGGLFRAGQPMEMHLTVTGLKGAPGASFRREVEMRDLFGRLVWSHTRSIRQREIDKGLFEEALSPPVERFGVFGLEIRILEVRPRQDGEDVRIEAQLFDRLARLPPPPEAKGFGLTVNPYAAGSHSENAAAAAVQGLGIRHAKFELWPPEQTPTESAGQAPPPEETPAPAGEGKPAKAAPAGTAPSPRRDSAAELAQRIPIDRDRLRRLLQRLERDRIELTGILAPVPSEMARGVRSARGADAEAGLSGRPVGTADAARAQPEAWEALLARTRACFAYYLTGWQLGSDADASFTGAQAEETVDLAARALSEGRRDPVIAVPRCVAGWRGPVEHKPRRPALFWVPPEMDADAFAATLEDAEARLKGRKAGPLFETEEWHRDRKTAMRETWLDVPLRPAPVSGGVAREEVAQLIDMARKIVTARRLGFEQIFVRLTDERRALMTEKLLPRAAYLGYRTLAQELASTEWVGEFDLGAGVEAHAFERRTRDRTGKEVVEGIIAAWTAGGEPVVKDRALGDLGRVAMLDLMGNRSVLAPAPGRGGQVRIEVGPVPVLLVGLDHALVKTHMAMQSGEMQVLWCDYRAQPIHFVFRKFFPDAVTVSIQPKLRPPAAVRPKARRTDIGEGEGEHRFDFMVRPALTQRAGPLEMPIGLRLEGKRRDRIEVRLTLDVRSELSLVPRIEYPAPDQANVRFRIRWTPKPEEGTLAALEPGRAPEPEPVNLALYLAVPGEARQRTAVRNLKPHMSRYAAHTFRVRLRDEPQKLRAGVQERSGTRFANIEFTLPAAGTGAAAETIAGRETPRR